MASTANIRAVITADDRASAVVKKFGSNVEDANKDVRAVANKAAIALGAVGAGMTLLAKNATEFTVGYVRDAKMIARETGSTVSEASRLIFVTQRMGVTAEEASRSFGIFSKNIVNTDDSFTKLGVKLVDNQGKQRTFNQILLDTADKFRAMPDGVNKTALALELFGRSGKEMIKVLNLGSAGISNLQAQADKLGLTLTGDNVARIAAYIESQKRLTDSTNALKLAIGETTAPVLTAFNNKVNEVILSLVATDSPMRGFTANVLAFGGPALSFIGGAIGVAANLATIAAVSTRARGAMLLLARTAAAGISIPAILGIANITALIIIAHQARDALNRLKGAIQDVNNTKVQAPGGGTVSGGSGPGLVEQLRRKFMFRAEGGPVSAREPYIVGEKGPEIFTPTRSGQIIPNNKMANNRGTGLGGNTTFNINVSAGVFMGSDVEARKFAKSILIHLKDVAGMQQTTIPEILST